VDFARGTFYAIHIFVPSAPGIERGFLRVTVSPMAPQLPPHGSVISPDCAASLTSVVSNAKAQCLPVKTCVDWCLPSPTLHTALAGPIVEFADRPIDHPDFGCDEVTR
jgi:hypothetical protein